MEDIRNGKVLILGDGNFSFAAAFCRRLDDVSERPSDSVVEVMASVRETRTELVERYPECDDHMRWLEGRGIRLHFGVDATRLDFRESDGRPMQFNHIVFNFPHVGGKTNLRKSRQLLHGVFMACQSAVTTDGRFYLTLANSQSGLSPMSADESTSIDLLSLPAHTMDSWQPVYLAAYGQFILEYRKPFRANDWISYGYRCAGYKNTSRRFRLDNSEVLVFRRAVDSASPSNLDRLQLASCLEQLHPLRPFYVHDIAFWISDKFDVDSFENSVRLLTKGLVKRIIPLPQYSCLEQSDECGTSNQRISLCYRLIWQAMEYSLTREDARDLQLILRDRLPPELAACGVTVVLR